MPNFKPLAAVLAIALANPLSAASARPLWGGGPRAGTGSYRTGAAWGASRYELSLRSGWAARGYWGGFGHPYYYGAPIWGQTAWIWGAVGIGAPLYAYAPPAYLAVSPVRVIQPVIVAAPVAVTPRKATVRHAARCTCSQTSLAPAVPAVGVSAGAVVSSLVAVEPSLPLVLGGGVIAGALIFHAGYDPFPRPEFHAFFARTEGLVTTTFFAHRAIYANASIGARGVHAPALMARNTYGLRSASEFARPAGWAQRGWYGSPWTGVRPAAFARAQPRFAAIHPGRRF